MWGRRARAASVEEGAARSPPVRAAHLAAPRRVPCGGSNPFSASPLYSPTDDPATPLVLLCAAQLGSGAAAMAGAVGDLLPLALFPLGLRDAVWGAAADLGTVVDTPNVADHVGAAAAARAPFPPALSPDGVLLTQLLPPPQRLGPQRGTRTCSITRRVSERSPRGRPCWGDGGASATTLPPPL